MEPDLGGQEKQQFCCILGVWVRVAMEPDLGGQEKRKPLVPEPHGSLHVAMEPDLGGQEKPLARWNPARDVWVAMEPDLGGQEKGHAMQRAMGQ